MPIYEYRCTACDHLVEVIHGINDPGPRFCESCGAEGTMRKGIGSPAVVFKGSGWARKERPMRRASTSATSDGGSSDRGSSDGGSSDGGSGSETDKKASDSSSSSSGSKSGAAAGPADD